MQIQTSAVAKSKPLPDSVIADVDKPLAQGFKPRALYSWALTEAKVINYVRCQLYIARKLNAQAGNVKFTEKLPKDLDCSGVDMTIKSK